MHLHFIAIGGSAMHNLALALHQKGETVSGSDDALFEPSRSRLENAGILPQEPGWFPEKISPEIDAVILGMHAHSDNPELLKAQELGLKIYSYPEFLFEQSKNKTRVVIGGSHGKTTITAMILHVMHLCGKEVDFMVGAQLEGFETMVHLTEHNEFIVLEGDEYLTSPIDRRPKFHWYRPDIALISGIAWDHINVFPTFENYVDQFRVFADTMTEGSTLIYNAEDKTVKEVAEKAAKPARKLPYRTPVYKVEDGTTILDTPQGRLPLAVFGGHNLSNLAGAREICRCMGIAEADFYKAIASFGGAAKRLEKIAENRETVVFKDYAHSPSKVRATTKAVREQYPGKKLLACLELHTYSSLNLAFLQHYRNSLGQADEAIVFFTPKAVEIKRLQKIAPKDIQAAFQHKNLRVFSDPKAFREDLKATDLNNTALLLMSSGNYGGLDFDRINEWI